MVWAHFQAAQAVDTSVCSEDQLRLRRLALRVVTPPTIKRASFEEDRSPDPRAIVSRIPGYVKDSSSALAGFWLGIKLGGLEQQLIPQSLSPTRG